MPEGAFAKDGHEARVSGVDAWHLHVEGQFERRDALQDELAVVGKLPFVPFQRQRQQAEADGHRQQNEQDQTCVPDMARLHSEESG
jgi:hypothetical protein